MQRKSYLQRTITVLIVILFYFSCQHLNVNQHMQFTKAINGFTNMYYLQEHDGKFSELIDRFTLCFILLYCTVKIDQSNYKAKLYTDRKINWLKIFSFKLS